MFYCQYLTGMGHLVRSTEIVRSLAEKFQVYFINGGPIVEGFKIPKNVESILLPSLWLEKGKFQISEGCQSVEQVKEIRKNQLINAFERIRPDCLITEFFPFGRHKLFFELLPLLEHVKSSSPETKIVSSIRDVIGRKTLNEESDIICKLINQYFDLILCHSDPSFQTFPDNFPRYQELKCEVKYTGFVAQSLAENLQKPSEQLDIDVDKPFIVASVGGGRLGYGLLETIIESGKILAHKIPHNIHIFTGPFMPDSQFFTLQKAAASEKNIKLKKYTSLLAEYMKQAELSISLTGYNTTMNILRTGVRSIVAPIGHYSQDNEQLIRTNKLEKLGIVEVVDPNYLESNHLAAKIIESLNHKKIDNYTKLFDLEGSQKTLNILEEFLGVSKVSTVNCQPSMINY
ncbi:glycosyltransferase family protein [Mastigocoleus testarum]|nr:glycosyltransferase [Mastigocoleus testarum]